MRLLTFLRPTQLTGALLVALATLFARPASAQCIPTPPADIDCFAGTAVTNNSNINSGTYVHCGSSGTFSNVNVSGGTLQICGVATISNITFNSGTIQIAQYATLTINSNLTLNNNCTIVNYGTLIINGNLQFQNSNNYVYNARTDARISVSGSMTFPSNVGQNAYLMNKGHITAGTVTLTDGIVVFCMENGSYLGVNNFNLSLNNINNPVTYGNLTGSAVIRYATSANLGGNVTKAVTLSSAITVCRATGAALSGSGSWGLASLTTGCAATTAPTQTGVVVTCYTLPVEWLSFDATVIADGVELSWATATETNNDYFEVQRAGSDGSYTTIATIDGAGNSSQINRYKYTWRTPAQGDNYFRIKQVDFNGEYDYSHPVYLNVTPKNEVSYTMNNPFNEQISVQVLKPETTLFLALYSEMGQQVLQSTLQEGSNVIETTQLAPGTYIAVISDAMGEPLSRHLVLKAR